MKKISLLIFSLSVFLFYISYSFEINYAVVQAYGQVKLIVKAQKIKQILADKNKPDSLKAKLRFIRKVKKFAEDSLGLTKTKNYETFYDAGKKEINWLVTAAYPFKLNSYKWTFPFVGSFPYLGFFNPKDANKEAKKLKNKGLDIKIGHPIAWSSLKIFKDPVLSTMLRYSKGKLAEIIIHETMHATVFLKSDAMANENIANFVGKKGSLLFLQAKYGINSKEYRHFINQLIKSKKTAHFMNSSALKLDSLYNSFPKNLGQYIKKQRKDSLMQIIQDQYISSIAIDSTTISYIQRDSFFFNNVNYLQYKIYNSKYAFLDSLLNTKYKRNLKQMVKTIKKNPNLISSN